MTEKRIKIVLDVSGAQFQAKSFEQQINKIGNATTKLNTDLTKLSKLIGATFALSQLSRYADAWTMVSNKIRQATDTMGQFYAVQQSVYEIAQGARSDVQGVALSFQRIDNAVKELGYSQADVMRVVEGLTLAFKANGQTAQEVSSVLIQLSQAFAKGRLDGDELRSVMEASLPVSRAIAKEFGVNVGQLKDLGEQGKLVTDRVFKALIQALPEFKAAFAESVPTISDSFTQLNNSLEQFIGSFNEAAGLSIMFNDAVKVVTGGLDELSSYLQSGALSQLGDLFAGQFVRATQSVNQFEGETNAVLDALLAYGNEFSTQLTKVISDGFFNVIPNITAFVQILTVELANAIEMGKVVIDSMIEGTNSETPEVKKKLEDLAQARLSTIEDILAKTEEEKKITNDVLINIQQARLERQLELEIETKKLEAVRTRTAVEVESEKEKRKIQQELDQKQKGQELQFDIQNENKIIEQALTERIGLYRTYSTVLNDLNASDYDLRVARLEMQYAEETARENDRYQQQLAKLNERKLEIINNEKLLASDKDAALDLLNEQAQLKAAENELALTAIREEGVAARARLDKLEADNRIRQLGQLGNALIDLGQGQSRKIFNIGKTLARAQAAISLPAAVMESFKNGGGYPWGLIPAGLMLAEGLKQIRSIENTSFDNGASASTSVGTSGGGGGSGIIPQLPTAPETVQNLSIVGGDEILKELRELSSADGVIPARIALRYMTSINAARRIGP